jgi:hypothetical protein
LLKITYWFPIGEQETLRKNKRTNQLWKTSQYACSPQLVFLFKTTQVLVSPPLPDSPHFGSFPASPLATIANTNFPSQNLLSVLYHEFSQCLGEPFSKLITAFSKLPEL